MKRASQHRISTEAEKVFTSIVPSEHVHRKQDQEDYGIDYEIELFREGETTGFIFKVQLKGTENLRVLADGNQISFNGFELPKAQYLIEEIEIPAAIVLVDVIKKQVYWTSVQDNKALRDAYESAKEAKRGEVTVHFNTHNILPETWLILFESMAKSRDYLALRHAAKIKPPRYSEYVDKIKDAGDIDWELIHLKQKTDILLSAKLRHLIETNQLNEANNLVDSILQSADRSIEVKFDTIIRHEEIWARSHRNQVTIIDRANFDIKQALQLKELCNSHDNIVAELKVLERGYFLTAKFNFLAVRDYQLQRNSVIAWEHDLEGPSWFIDLHEERKKSAKITGSAFGEIIEYISKLASDQYWQFIPEFVTRAAQSIIFILQRLKAEGLLDGPEGIEKWFDIALDFVLRLIGGLNAILRIDVYHLKCATLYIQFLAVFYDDPEKQSLNLTKTKQIISQIEDSNSQTEAHRMLDKTIALCESENVA